MRILPLLPFLAAMIAAAPASAVPARHAAPHVTDWSRVAAFTPAGGILLGNPQARVRLVEFLSYTCPHCGAFAGEAFGPLTANYVKGGQLSLEIRTALRDRLDYVAAQVARCGGPGKAIGNTEAIFAAQAEWEPKAIAWDDAHRADFQNAGAGPAMRQLADAAGLTAIVTRQGVPAQAFATCIGDKRVTDALQKTSEEAWTTRHIAGTPAFLIDDVYQESVLTWAALEPLLQAALKR